MGKYLCPLASTEDENAWIIKIITMYTIDI